VRWSALTAGAIGLAGGVAAGARDERTIGRAATGAGVGFLIGAGTGFVLKPLVQRFSWQDVAALGLVGGAIGSAPTGSAIGVAAGGVTGLLLWQAFDGFEMPHAIAVALAGLAVGGLAEWVADGTGAGSIAGPAVQLTIPVRLNLR